MMDQAYRVTADQMYKGCVGKSDYVMKNSSPSSGEMLTNGFSGKKNAVRAYVDSICLLHSW